MSDTCLSCQLPVREEESAKCNECSYMYHFGKCAGLQEKSYKSKSEAAKKSWKCATCKSVGPRTNRSDSEVDVSLVLASINQKLECLPDLIEKVNAMEQSVQFISKKFDEFQEKMSNQDTEIKELRKRVTELEEREKVHASAECDLQRQVNDLEYRSRRLNLEVHGIPVVGGENLMTSLNEVADKLEVPPLTKADIASMHRLPAKQGRIPGIIIRFTKEETRDAWLKNKKSLADWNPRIFLQENLTRHSRELLRATKAIAKRNGYSFVWYVNGKILVRKSEGAHVVHIRDKDDLEEL